MKPNKIVKPNLAKITNIRQRRRTYLKYVKDFYNTANRGYNEKDGFCKYSAGKNSPGCAIGQFLVPKTAKLFDYTDLVFGYGSDIRHILEDENQSKLIPEWMKELDVEFLVLVQRFHDTMENWNNNGVSDEGMKFYRNIKNQYHL